MKPAITIRIAKSEADLDVIRTLQRVCLPYDDLVDPRKGVWLVARTGKGVAVAFSGGYEYKLETEKGSEHAFIISRQGVIKAANGLGLQKRLIAEHERQCAESGIPEIWTYTAVENLASGNSFVARQFRMWTPAFWDYSERILEPGKVPPQGTSSPQLSKFIHWRKRVIK